MKQKIRTGLAVTALVTLTGGVAWAQDPGGGKAAGGRAETEAVGEDIAVYIPIVPCRVLDTRSPAATGVDKGPFAPGETRQIRVYDGASYVGQGGKAGECGIANNSLAVEASVTAIAPSADGYFRAWPTGSAPPNATFLNFTRGESITNTGSISVSADDTKDLTVKNVGATTHYVIDIQGYFAPATVS